MRNATILILGNLLLPLLQFKAIFTTHAQEYGSRCANKTMKWIDLGGDFCYIIEKYKDVSWMHAVYKCFMEGGSLASFHSTEEIIRILRYLKNEKNLEALHIGLWKSYDGSFQWVDRTVLDFKNWHHGEPSLLEEKCVAFRPDNGYWNDIQCYKSEGYICSSPKVLLSHEPEKKICPDTSLKWDDFGGDFCYTIETQDKVLWHDALRHCMEAGGSLASFHSIEEISTVVHRTRNLSESLHFGLRQNSNGKFEWTDRTPMDLEMWQGRQPYNHRDKCGSMNSQTGGWSVTPCSSWPRGYICSTPKVAAGISSKVQIQVPNDFALSVSCGGNIVSDTGSVQSPNYPHNYPPNQNCFWEIEVSENYQIALSFRIIEVEYGTSCEFDYIEVLDGHDKGSPLLRKLCGSEASQTIISSRNKMSIKFVSDEINEKSGFSADFARVELCGGNLVSDEGVVETRNFPSNYWSNDICLWKITVPDNYKVLLRFNSLDMEESNNECIYDYVEIRDGHDSTSPILGQFCGYNSSTDVISSGHKITVKFQSDYFREYPGFSAEFNKSTDSPTIPSTVLTEHPHDKCGGYITAEKGAIFSPNYPNKYFDSMSCIWVITIPGDHEVVLRFKAFKLENGPKCNNDYVVVHGGHDSKGPVLGRFCDDEIPSDVISSGNEMTVIFNSDSFNEYSGFAAVFKKGNPVEVPVENQHPSDELCRENIFSEEGILQSPNFPKNYGPNERCTWRITVPKNHQVLLKFLSFQVEVHDECNYDNVEIRDGHGPGSLVLAKLCGYEIPNDFRSSGNKLMIIFKSDSSSEYGGFSVEFKKEFPVVGPTTTHLQETDDCGGVIHSDSGLIQSPNYPDPYRPLESCTWNITVPEGKKVVLQFQTLMLEYDDDCKFDYVKVLDGLEDSSTVLGKFCNDLPEIIRSSKSTMAIQLVTDDTIEKAGFYANFSTADVCHKDIIADEGEIQSPNYPNSYGPSEKCVWNITVPEKYRINLMFLEVKLHPSFNCRSDFVEIRDGHGEESLDIGRLCVTHSIERYRSSANQLSIVFQSDGSEEGKGFHARFQKDMCGGEVFSDNGTISSPNYPGRYGKNEHCVWKITVPEKYQISLTFHSHFEIETGNLCRHDFVEIRDGHEDSSPLLGKFCGRRKPNPIRSSTNKMQILFVSDNIQQSEGFIADFTKVVASLSSMET